MASDYSIPLLAPTSITLHGDQDAEIAGKIRTALNANSNVAAFFTVGGSGATVVLTAKTKAANDATLNISIADGTSAGVTTAATSANTTAGVAAVLQVETATIIGTIISPGNATIVVTAAGMTGTPITLNVAVDALDTASQVATKVRTALNANANIAAWFTISGATDAIILTAKAAAANDATMNLASDNGTCTGLTTAATSANTTAGALGVLQVETATAAGNVLTSGNATVVVTAAGMTGSPETVSVAVLNAVGTSQVIGDLAGYRDLFLMLNASLVPAGGSPTLDVYLQTSPDGGTTWQDIAHTQFTGTAAKRFLAISGAVSGGTAILAAKDAALTGETIVQGPWGDRLRLKYVFSPSTSAGPYALAASMVCK